LALLRSIPTSGRVLYDDKDITQLNLDALRSSVTLIPQQPEVRRRIANHCNILRLRLAVAWDVKRKLGPLLSER
jgi:ABC-type cobalamin/Fe3+-siderophores transport system ATPase subunit